MIRLNTDKSLKTLIAICSISIIISVILLINSHRKEQELEKKLDRINRELYFIEIRYKRRLKEFDVESKKHQAEIDQMLKEIKANK